MKKKIFLFISFLFYSILFGQNKLSFDFNYARFKLDSVNTYLEIYYSFNQKNLKKFLLGEKGYFIGAVMHIQIVDSLNKNVVNQRYKIQSPFVKLNSRSKNRSLMGEVCFVVPPGNYLLKISATDLGDSSRRNLYTENLKIHPFFNDKISISDVELCSRIIQNNNKSSLFYKNTYEVIPNPSLIYSNKLPVLFYYSELYNLKEDHFTSNLVLIKKVFNSRHKLVFRQVKSVKRNANSIVEVGIINLRKFSTDSYTLVISLNDTSKGIGSSSSQQFFYYNPEKLNTATTKLTSKQPYLSSEYGVLTESDCDLLFDESKYIASAKEIATYRKLKNLNGKRRFLYNFWLRRDPNPSTPENEFKDKYMKRLQYVNEHFGTINKPGYKTDRGRVYLIYGPYDQIDRYPSEPNRKPYEIWYYNSIEGGVIFVFGDLGGYSDYELLHSTKKGEFHDYSWQRRIIQNP